MKRDPAHPTATAAAATAAALLVRLVVPGSYVPENHSRDEDDQSLGFGGARLCCEF